MPVYRNWLFLTRDLEDVAYLRRLSDGLRFYEEAVRTGLTQDLIQNGLLAYMPTWETSTIFDCWDMMNEEPLICEIITAFLRIPTDEEKHLATGGAMLKHFVDPLIENWPGNGVPLSGEVIHRNLKAEWNDFLGRPSGWSHPRTPKPIVQRSQAAGISRARRGSPDAVHRPGPPSAAALPSVSHGASRSPLPSPRQNRRTQTPQVKRKIATRQKSRLNQVSATEETPQLHQQRRQSGRSTQANRSAIPVLPAETRKRAVEVDPDETEDDADSHSLETADGNYKDEGEKDLDFDKVQPLARTLGAKKSRTEKSKSVGLANTKANILHDAKKKSAEKIAQKSASRSAAMRARWADGRMNKVMEKINQIHRTNREAKLAASSMEPVLVPEEKTLELEETTPTPAPERPTLRRKRQALDGKKATITMGKATASATEEEGNATSSSNVDFAFDVPHKENDPFMGVGDAVRDANKHPNEDASRGPRFSVAATSKTSSQATLRKEGDVPIDDGNLDFEPAVRGVCDPSKLRISVDHERTLSDGKIVSGLPGEYSTGTRIHLNYSGKVNWNHAGSIKKLNRWRYSTAYHNFKSGWRDVSARWLQSEKDWIVAYMQAQNCNKWNRLTNAYNKHFENVLQLKGEPFINVCGDNPVLGMDRKAPWRTREAIEAVAKRWQEYQTLFPGDVSQTGPEDGAVPKTKPRISLLFTKRPRNGDGQRMEAESQPIEAELPPMTEPSMTSNLAPPMASTIDATRSEPAIAGTLSSPLANTNDNVEPEPSETGTSVPTKAGAFADFATQIIEMLGSTHEIAIPSNAKSSDGDELKETKKTFKKTSRVSFGGSGPEETQESRPRKTRQTTFQTHGDSSRPEETREMRSRKIRQITTQTYGDMTRMGANTQRKQTKPVQENYDDGPEYSEEFVSGVLEAWKKRRAEEDGQAKDNEGPSQSSGNKPELS